MILLADTKQFVFFDFEMLCSNRGMPFEKMEAIRLGAVIYNIETKETAFFDRFIKPLSNEPLSVFCRKLTGISDTDLVGANCFSVVFEEFLTWVGGIKKSRFFSWSKSDLMRLRLDAMLHKLPETTISKIEKRYVDFQDIFTKRVTKTNYSVENALKLYDLSFFGDAHNPMYDAFNTLRIYLEFLNNPFKSDLIMLHHYVFEGKEYKYEQIHREIKNQFNEDCAIYFSELRDMYRMKDAYKVIKRTKKLVDKYENIVVNRANIFSEQLSIKITIFIRFYHDLLLSYEEHAAYASKIMILDDYMMKSHKDQLLKQG
ncbi:3'-5' exonuclease [Cytobacillus luteolus]|uniref:3'-5' exonuclease n=1 Tax=Litchfieldia luteola TaxID=682179 RepID=UPI003872CCFF